MINLNYEEKINRKLRRMKKNVDFLRSIEGITIKMLSDNWELLSAVERNLQVAIEFALDIGEMIIIEENQERPETYKGVIEKLGNMGVLDSKFASDFSHSAGFRNILVHLYEEIDITRVFTFLTSKLSDFDVFSKYIAEYLEKRLNEA